jgi:hypothetical protein
LPDLLTFTADLLVVDLLLFHLTQLRCVVVELKVGRFHPGYVGQLGTYVAMVDDLVRDQTIHAPTVGILLCTSRNEQVVRYAISGTNTPLAVADYTYDALPTTSSSTTSPEPDASAGDTGSAELQALLDSTMTRHRRGCCTEKR